MEQSQIETGCTFGSSVTKAQDLDDTESETDIVFLNNTSCHENGNQSDEDDKAIDIFDYDEEYSDEEIDPRIQEELETLNTASNEINILEKELDEARAIFRQFLTDATHSLRSLANHLGHCIDKARPYFESIEQSKKARQECQAAAMRFEKACSDHKAAKETIRMAEQKLEQNPGSFQFDTTWQEMLNHADIKLLNAGEIRHKSEKDHREAALAYSELEERSTRLGKDLKRVVNKARPYYQQKTSNLEFLERQKQRVVGLESSYEKAKKTYAGALTSLENISEEIHRKRSETSKTSSIPNEPRQECIGEEAPVIDIEEIRRTESLSRKEAKLKRILTRKKKPFTRNAFRHSLCIDLGIGTEFDVGNVLESPQSPGARSIDLGAVLSRSFEDYEILEIDSLERTHSMTRQLSVQSADLENR